jgi:broad specificity phosphatase PhoE
MQVSLVYLATASSAVFVSNRLLLFRGCRRPLQGLRQQQRRSSSSATSAASSTKHPYVWSSSSALDSTRMTTSNRSRNHHVKDVWIIRHGQAVHNPRAEHARETLHCSHAEFLRLMQQDDCFDAPLTNLGIQQASNIYQQHGIQHWKKPAMSNRNIQRDCNEKNNDSSAMDSGATKIALIVASPLSRALQTAELALGDDDAVTDMDISTTDRYNNSDVAPPPPPPMYHPIPNRVCYEGFREIHGWLYNAQRKTKAELQNQYPQWDFSLLSTDHDALWSPELETTLACGERGYEGLLWMMQQRVEQSILLVTHGGLLKYTLTEHPMVVLRDGRQQKQHGDSEGGNHQHRCIHDRYQNGELRRYRMELVSGSRSGTNDESRNEITADQSIRDTIILTEIDF